MAFHPIDRDTDYPLPPADGGTGVRHHQVGAGLPPVSVAWPGKCSDRMDAGVPGVEFEAHGRIASAVARNGGIRASNNKSHPFRAVQPRFYPSRRLKSDRLL